MHRNLSALLAMLVVLAGCSDSTGPDPQDHMIGIWRLESVNGQPVPFRYEWAKCNLDLTHSELRFANYAPANQMSSISERKGGIGTVCTGEPIRDTHEGFGWGMDGDSLILNIFYASGNFDTHKGRVAGDVIILNYRDGFRLPDGTYRYRKVSDTPFP